MTYYGSEPGFDTRWQEIKQEDLRPHFRNFVIKYYIKRYDADEIAFQTEKHNVDSISNEIEALKIGLELIKIEMYQTKKKITETTAKVTKKHLDQFHTVLAREYMKLEKHIETAEMKLARKRKAKSVSLQYPVEFVGKNLMQLIAIFELLSEAGYFSSNTYDQVAATLARHCTNRGNTISRNGVNNKKKGNYSPPGLATNSRTQIPVHEVEIFQQNA